MKQQEAIETFIDRVTTELREIAVRCAPAPYSLPMPFDMQCEQDVVSALLRGDGRPSELACKADDFGVGLYRCAFEALTALETVGQWPEGGDAEPNLGRIVRGMGRLGFNKFRLANELLHLRDNCPFVYEFRARAERVALLACRRLAILHMRRVIDHWCLLDEAPEGAVPEMLQVVEAATR